MKISDIIKKYVPKTKKTQIEGRLILFEVNSSELLTICSNLYKTKKLPLKTIKATDQRKNTNDFRIYYVFGIKKENMFIVPYLKLKNTTNYPSIVSKIHEATRYELEIKSFFGLNPIGHPQSNEQFILHGNWPTNMFPLRKDFNWKKRPPISNNVYKFQQISGEGIYEIPVGPVHAGIIEPGHFRFSVAGEEIVSLEPHLGYTHKGSEKLFEVLPLEKKIKLSERISGDSSFVHSVAFCMALEDLYEISVPTQAKYLRIIFAELERIANHFSDIGFIMNDTAYSFGGASGGRLREQIMQWNEKLTGSRFLRGVNIIGGVTKTITKENKKQLNEAIKSIEKDFSEIIQIAEDNESLINRLKGTGILKLQTALDHGVLGLAAKAAGLPLDARIDFPYGAYNEFEIKIPSYNTSDVYARYRVRIDEVHSSMEIILRALGKLEDEKIKTEIKGKKMKKNSFAIGISEGWRGDIVYLVITDNNGDIERVGIRDCSFLNWATVPHAVLENIVPDFPLINKSFNLSYSGNDR